MWAENHIYIEQNFGWNHTNQQIRLSYNSEGVITQFLSLTWSSGNDEIIIDQDPKSIHSVLSTWKEVSDWYSQSSAESFLRLALYANFQGWRPQKDFEVEGININEFEFVLVPEFV